MLFIKGLHLNILTFSITMYFQERIDLDARIAAIIKGTETFKPPGDLDKKTEEEEEELPTPADYDPDQPPFEEVYKKQAVEEKAPEVEDEITEEEVKKAFEEPAPVKEKVREEKHKRPKHRESPKKAKRKETDPDAFMDDDELHSLLGV